MSGSVSTLRESLAGVVPASAMPVFAHERLLPVHPGLAPLFAAGDSVASPGGLVRGQTVVCSGSAAISCALGLVAGVTRSGSWAAIVGLPSVGVLAAATIGVSLERTVFVRPPHGETAREVSGDIGSALSALVDGMDLVVLSKRFLSGLPPALVRRLQSRAQSKGSVLLIVGEPVSTSVDIRFTTRTVHWEGIGQGYGHLQRRMVAVEIDGRRCPRQRQHSVWLPDAAGGLTSVDGVQANPSGRSATVLHRVS